MTDLSSDASPSRAANGPGRLLRQAREQAGLSIDDLSAQIKLARGTLDALERDDFRVLNEPVYVRGYYRKLAKVLPVAEADLLAAYGTQAPIKAPPAPSKLILAGGHDLGASRGINFKLVAGVILVGLVIGLLAFWGSRREGSVPAPVTAVEPTTAPVEPASSAPGAEATPADSQAPAAAPTGSASPPPAHAATATVQAPPLTLAPSLSAPVPTAASSATGNKPVTPIGRGELQLQFTGTSWARVEDATGKSLLSGVIQAGESQTLSGEAPFSVFVGNAPGVQMKFNGQAVDMTQYSKGNNTARFTLP